MKGISINLLPTETTTLRKQVAVVKKIRFFSIIFLLMMFFLASLLITLRVFQTQTIGRFQAEAQTSEEQIVLLRERESTLILLKDRLDQIAVIESLPSKPREMYELFMEKLGTANISSISIDSNGDLSLSASVSDAVGLTNMLTTLTTNENFNKITSVNLDSLSRGKDGTYKFSLKLIAR